jgi:imidazolonepropionase-like amidohydrolase
MGVIPLRVHAHRADDICTAIRIAEEFNIKLVIEHGTSAHVIADYLVKKKIPLVLGPFLSTRKKPELVDRTFETAGILSSKGALIAITVDHPVIPIDTLIVNAALAHRHGMDYYEALKSVTINPAKICLCDNKIGSLEKGKDADILVLNGDPLDARSKPVAVYQDGHRVDSN